MSKIRLITGGIGTGKSLWTVEQLFKEHEKTPERQIYTDITGIKHTGILKAPDDWREIPNNSLIVYDEVQYRDLFSRHNSKRDKQILDLTTIRKRGIELWLITQRARFLNADVLGLVNEHVHLERVGQKVSNVYIWQEAELNITKTKKLFAFDKYRWAYPEHIFGFYESIQPDAKHNKRSYLNKAVVGVIVTLIFALIAGIIFVYNASKKGISVNGVDNKKPQYSAQQPKNTQTMQPPVAQQVDQKDLNYLCRKAENVSKPECVQWFDNLSKSGGSITGEQNAQIVHYDAAKPYDVSQVSYNYQVRDLPQFVGCVHFNGRYYGYTQQGTRLAISQSDCKKYMNGDRPFNPFREPLQVQNVQSNTEINSTNNHQPTAEELAKIDQAKQQGLI